MKVTQSTRAAGPLLWFAALLAGILALLFWRSFLPGFVHFSNDGPLGAQHTAFLQLPAGFTGMWDDINSIGYNAGSFSPSLTAFLSWWLGPIAYSKYLAPIALFILGLGAWFFFRQLRFTQLAAVLGGLAMALNSAFLSTACWGVASQQVAVGMEFLAMGLIVSITADTPRLVCWARLALAGLAVGMGVMEGADNGAIYSVFVAAFALYYSLTGDGALTKKLVRGVTRVAVIGVFAGLIATHTVVSLIGSAIVGVGGGTKGQPNQMGYDWATIWSLPKIEALGFVVPGLFGYRMNTPDGGHYWGMVGSEPAWDKYLAGDKQGPPPRGNLRFTGGNPYMGVLVTVVALWAVLQSLNKKDSAFTLRERRLIWFWSIVSVICLLLSFGRFAPFYKIFYALPGTSFIRNPVKFIAVFSFSAIAIFAYGVNGLARKYMAANATLSPQGWWKRASQFDKRWVMGSVFAVVLSLMAWWWYGQRQTHVEDYLVELQRVEALARNSPFNSDGAHDMAQAQASFSVRQVGWFVLFVTLSSGLVALTLRGTFAGGNAKLGGILLGVLLVVDLGQAARYWILHWDYKEKYDMDASRPGESINPLIERLRAKPYEARVVILPNWFPYIVAQWFGNSFRVTQELMGAEQSIDQLYGLEWSQHHFPYYNIQSLDVIQMPRPPADLATFEDAVRFQFTPETLSRVARRWELTNTRYIIGAAPWLSALNGSLDPARNGFRVAERFSLALKPGVTQYHNRLEEITARLDPNGNYALFEFTNALPRARLFAKWQRPADDAAILNELKTSTLTTNDLEYLQQIGTNDFLTLKMLSAPSFDPHQTVLVADPLPAPTATTATNHDAGTVEFSSYSPKKIVLKADAKTPSVLLLNDKFDPMWKVTVDGRPEKVLRCNYAMRGVFLLPGAHTIEYNFQAPTGPLFVSIAGLVLAVILSGYLFATRRASETAGGKVVRGGT